MVSLTEQEEEFNAAVDSTIKQFTPSSRFHNVESMVATSKWYRKLRHKYTRRFGISLEDLLRVLKNKIQPLAIRYMKLNPLENTN